MNSDSPKSARGASTPIFIGRLPEFHRIDQLVAAGLQGKVVPVAVTGPGGIGKSEFLRQMLLRLDDTGAEFTPLFFDLLEFDVPEETNPREAEAEIWTSLIRSLARQFIAHDRRLPAQGPPLLGISTQTLAQLSYDSGLSDWAELIRDGVNEETPAAEVWQAMLHARSHSEGRGHTSSTLVVIDGLGSPSCSPALRRVGRALVRAAIAAGRPLLFEADAFETQQWPESSSIEFIELEGLSTSESLTLIESKESDAQSNQTHYAEVHAQQVHGRDLGDALPKVAARGVIERLAGNPELLHSWVAAWIKLPSTMSVSRRAWEAYLQILGRGPTALRWRREVEAALPLDARPIIVGILSSIASHDAAISGAELRGRSGLDNIEAEKILSELTRHGLLSRRGIGYAVPPVPALADWLEIHASGDESRARADLLRRFLGTSQQAAVRGIGRPVGELLENFSLQRLPEALFQLGQYHEALGGFSPERRKAEVLQSARTLRLPEVIGVVKARQVPSVSLHAEKSRSAGITELPLHYAYAFRESIYQRSHEETWIAGDCSRSQTLTSAEVGEFVEAARSLEQRLGPGRYVRWLIAGESASGEALERIARERIFCSGLEQLSLIAECLTGPAERTVPRPAEKSAQSEREPAPSTSRIATQPSTTVIPISEVGEKPISSPWTRLVIRAEGENEVIASLAAERIALRRGFDTEAAAQVRTAVNEGCLNAIEHSGNSEKEVTITYIEHPTSLEIVIDNEGEQFDPLAVADPDPRQKLKARNKRGWGIKLMKGFMDEVVYEPRPKGTRLRLIKLLVDKDKDSDKRPLELLPGRQ